MEVDQFEYHVEVPYTQDDDTAAVTVHVNKVGGGTLGHSYEGRWEVAITINGTVTFWADDIRTGTPKTHAQVAGIAAEFYANSLPEWEGLRDRLIEFTDWADPR